MKNLGPRVIRFGMYQADPVVGELRKDDRRIALQEQPFRLLLLLLEQPGELVTRDEIQRKLWGDTYVDFEEGLNTAVRKLRDALSDSAANPVFIETLPRRGYRFIAPVEIIGAAQPDPEPIQISPRPLVPWVWIAGLTGAVIIVAGLIRFWPSHQRPAWTLTSPKQLTRDSGLTTDPVISKDGTILAYASDRGGAGNLDIWVQHISGGEPHVLASHPANDYEPEIAPDGSEVVFRSDRDGGGIYSVPTFGGDAKLLIKDGYVPRFSPEGSRISYSLGAFGSGGFGGRLHIYSRQTGSTQRLAPTLFTSGPAAWSPDGRYLVFVAATQAEQPRYVWICQVDTGEVTQMSTAPLGQGVGLLGQNGVVSVAWLDNQLVLSVSQGDTSNLWAGVVSLEKRQLEGKLKRITLGSGNEVFPSASANGKLVFANHSYSADIWEATLDPKSPGASMRQLTKDRALNYRPSISADGTKLAYVSNRSGNFDVWVKDLASGKEAALTRTAQPEIYAVISRDGSQVASWDGTNINLVNTSSGATRLLCEKCGRPEDWSADGKLLARPDSSVPSGIGLWDTEKASLTKLVGHPTLHLTAAKVSLDGKWVTFHSVDSKAFNRNKRQILIAPYTGNWTPLASWIAVTDGEALDREPQWSADGNLIYFLSDRDGFRCIWARKLDPKTKQPVGAIYPLLHMHDPRLSLLHVPSTGHVGIIATGNQLMFAMGELTGNLWMTELGHE